MDCSVGAQRAPPHQWRPVPRLYGRSMLRPNEPGQASRHLAGGLTLRPYAEVGCALRSCCGREPGIRSITSRASRSSFTVV